MSDMAACTPMQAASSPRALVLAVDGNLQRAGRFCALLETLGLLARAVTETDAALSHCRRDMPQLLLLSTGKEDLRETKRFLARLQRLPRSECCAVIACLKISDPALAAILIMAGAHDCLCVPLNSEILAWKLRILGLNCAVTT